MSLVDRQSKNTSIEYKLRALSGKIAANIYKEQLRGCKSIDEPEKKVKK